METTDFKFRSKGTFSSFMENMPEEKRKMIIGIVVVATLLIIGGLALRFTGSFIGPSIEELEESLDACNTSLCSCTSERDSLKTNVISLNNDKVSLETQIESCTTNLNEKTIALTKSQKEETNLKNQLSEITVEYNETKAALDSVQLDYEDLAENYANEVCCAAQRYITDIDGYELEDNEIRCVTNGGRDLDCD